LAALENTAAEQDHPRYSKFEELPDELEALRDRGFETQDNLQDAIEQLGYEYLRVERPNSSRLSSTAESR
jgi:hypothetical protein